MKKKQLNTTEVMNELRGQSVFFPQAEHKPNSQEQPPKTVSNSLQASEKASNDASKLARTLAVEMNVATIHKTLKLIGKEVLYVRLTQEEKNQVADIEYTYQRQGMKTSGNEIGRIALNVLLVDYKANGENSLLAKMLTELHT